MTTIILRNGSTSLICRAEVLADDGQRLELTVIWPVHWGLPAGFLVTATAVFEGAWVRQFLPGRASIVGAAFHVPVTVLR